MSSNYVYPDLPLIDVHVDRERIDNTSIYESPSGAEQRVSWYTAPRYRYRVHYPALRDYMAAPAPWTPYSELGAVLWFLDQHRGPGQSFLFNDPRVKTNLLSYSQDFSQSAWAKNSVTVTPNALAAPDGTVTAGQIIDNASNAQHYVGQNISGLIIGATYTVSVHMKAGTLGYGYVQLGGTYVFVNLATGASDGGPGVLTALQMSNGWWKFSTQRVAAAASENMVIGVYATPHGVNTEVYAGSGQSAYAWGAQAEPASSAGLYVPTGASPITGQVRVRFEEDTLRVRRVVNDIWEAEFSLISVAA